MRIVLDSSTLVSAFLSPTGSPAMLSAEKWDELFKVLAAVRYQGSEPRPSPEEEECMVAEIWSAPTGTSGRAARGTRRVVSS
jgi:hypothetical protein